MTIKDLLFPKLCLGCAFIGAYICPRCWKKIVAVGKPTCLYCNKASLYGLTHPGCLKRLNVDGIVAIYEYSPLMRKTIKSIKYRLAHEILDEFIKNIRPGNLRALFELKRASPGALIQPIPLSHRRLRLRGFNQAYLIGKFFSAVLGLDMVNYLIRVNDPGPQAEVKSRAGRYRNIRGVFRLRPKTNIKNAKIILVDDVVTTGATVTEAAKVFKANGADRVYVLALARG